MAFEPTNETRLDMFQRAVTHAALKVALVSLPIFAQQCQNKGDMMDNVKQRIENIITPQPN